MNAAYIHLALNHFPLIMNVAAVLVLIIGLGARSAAVIRTALVLIVATALFAIPTFLTGDDAEHVVKRIEGVNATAIDPHEESADWAITLCSIEGVAALALLIAYRRREIATWAAIAMLLLALIGTATVARTAYLGGKIHHPETEIAP